MSYAAQVAMAKHVQTRSLQGLMGIVQGILADGLLHDDEILMLKTWLSANRDLCAVWPGSAIARMVEDACADGAIDEAERKLLMDNMTALVGVDFSNTGSVSAGPTSLPIDDSAPIELAGQVVVHTGTFLYGTRARCERATQDCGGVPASSVTKKTRIVVIGGMVTPSWVTESFGRKIMQAVEMRDAGLPVRIISEQHWQAHLGAVRAP